MPEVAIYFENSLFRANRTSKVSAEHFEAFRSPNYPLLAEAGINIRYNRFAIRKAEVCELTVRHHINHNVGSIRFFPGLRKEVFQAVSRSAGLQGLILETYGSGNTFEADWLKEELYSLKERGVIVLNITQCITGGVVQNKYATGAHLQEAGVIEGRDLTFEAAIAKMMYLLSCEELTLPEKKSYLATNLRGEMS